MASGSPDVKQTPEGEEASDECLGKKKSKFQTFKKFFAKKKRKEPAASSRDSNLKPSQSSSDVSIPDPINTTFNSPSDLGAKGTMGNKALSHESVFISEPASENAASDGVSKENLPGKVKALQLQLESNIRVGSPPQVIRSKASDDAGAVSEDDGLPQSPPEMSTLHDILACSSSKSSQAVEHRSSLSLGGTDSEDEQFSSESLSRAISPLPPSLIPVDFNSPASSLGCLDNSAARHKISLNPRKNRNGPKRRKLAAEAETTREKLPKLSEEISGVRGVGQNSLCFEGAAANEELTGFVRTSDTDKTRLNEPLEHANRNSVPSDACVSLLNTSFLEDDQFFLNNKNVSTPEVVSNQEPGQNEDCVDMDLIKEEKVIHCPSCASPSESEMVPRDLVLIRTELTDISAKLTDVAKCQDDADLSLASINDSRDLKESINVTTSTVEQDNVLNPAAQIENEQQDRNVPSDANLAVPQGNENSMASETALSINIAQGMLPTSSPSDEKDVLCSESGQKAVPEITSTMEDQEMSNEKSNSENNVKILDVPEHPSLDRSVLIQKSPKKPDDFMAENSNLHIRTKSLNESDNVFVEYTNQPWASDCGSRPIVGNDAEKHQIAVTSATTPKKMKTSNESPQSQQKATKKPVRFTIAPAWQRSLSGGSSTKEDPGVRNTAISTIKSELFEGSSEEHACSDNAKPASTASSSEDTGVVKRAPQSFTKPSENGAQSAELPFGVRLKIASSFSKCSDEKSSDFQIPDSTATQTSLLKDLQKADSTVKDLQKTETTVKATQISTAVRKSSLKQSDLWEEKDIPSTKLEEAPKKQQSSKSQDKGINKLMASPTSEPVWVTMAKLKQKGFQGHPLAKEQTTPDKGVTGTETEEIPSCVTEGHRKSPIISHVDEEKTEQHHGSTTADAVGVHPSRETSSPSVPEKGVRQPAILPIAQQHPEEPPWLSLAKKKAKAWSEMPQIVQ
ncbi:acrosomal protein KIAA1210-like isoform X2 [Ambystoma mexicanum]